jgi:hypothetical protein
MQLCCQTVRVLQKPSIVCAQLLFHLRSLIPCADIVQYLDIKALPYVIFLIVPVLGRMSDPDDDIRSATTNTFASLVKMVPLEVCTCLSVYCSPFLIIFLGWFA